MATLGHQSTLAISPIFQEFIERELLPVIAISAGEFWTGLAHIIRTLTPINRELLRVRQNLQNRLDEYHQERAGTPWNHGEYLALLKKVGYLHDKGPPFQITTQNIDVEISSIAGPQLVVPVNNARFAVNAANARWGSLYDALYGTDVIDESHGQAFGKHYNATRGNAVIEYSKKFLDRAIPLMNASFLDVVRFKLDTSGNAAICSFVLANSSTTSLADSSQFVGFRTSGTRLALLFINHGLHIEIQTDPEHPIGKAASANVSDILLESAITTIQDCEDSVTAIDAEDKVSVYRNWLGLMQGTLAADFVKGGKLVRRSLNDDREYQSANFNRMLLSGRSLMLVRNVGHLMTTDAVRDQEGYCVFEGILDAVVTVACALTDVKQKEGTRNSRAGSIYVVKPKIHGPDEAAYTNTLMSMVEDMMGLKRNTVKIGLMDEERRTTVNLYECIRALKHRLVFINTGFLDRTADEIRTSMHAGPVLPKEEIKLQPWLTAYEEWNVAIGIQCGLPRKAQIGKGMWPKTDRMREMMETKHVHPRSGANCAWVPSPTAATLHAMHYHYVNVPERQQAIAKRPLPKIEQILTPPLMEAGDISVQKVQDELDNNTQSILGYVVRWVDQGIGCSKVPDISGVPLMEDRATLRISSQHIANWLLHGICTKGQVLDSFRRTAEIVDKQNSGDPAYSPMCINPEASLALNAAQDLVFKGISQPNGYTEPVLHDYRERKKREIQERTL